MKFKDTDSRSNRLQMYCYVVACRLLLLKQTSIQIEIVPICSCNLT